MSIELSCKARYLLRQAAADPERQIEYFDLAQGIIISANGEDIINEHMSRGGIPNNQRNTVEAGWCSALDTLERKGLVVRTDNIHFRITEDGYEYSRRTSSGS